MRQDAFSQAAQYFGDGLRNERKNKKFRGSLRACYSRQIYALMVKIIGAQYAHLNEFIHPNNINMKDVSWLYQ
jgi:hypothetical protein